MFSVPVDGAVVRSYVWLTPLHIFLDVDDPLHGNCILFADFSSLQRQVLPKAPVNAHTTNVFTASMCILCNTQQSPQRSTGIPR